MMRRLIAFVRSFARFAGRRAVTAFAFVLAGAALEGIGILLLVPVLERVIGQPTHSASGLLSRASTWLGLESQTSQLVIALACFAGLLAVRGGLIWARDIRLMQLSLGFVDHWRTKLFTALTAAPWATSAGLARARIEHAILDDVARMSTGTDRILRGLASLAMLIGQGIIAAVLSPALTALVLVFVAVGAVLSAPLIIGAQRLGERLTGAGQSMFELIHHFLSGLKIAKAHRAEAHYVVRFDRTVSEVRNQIVAFASRQAIMRVVFQFCAGILASTVILVGVLVLHTPLAVLAVFTLILARLTAPFLACLQNLQQFANMLPAFDNVECLLAELEQAGAGRAPVRAAGLAQRAGSGVMRSEQVIEGPLPIELRDVTYAHAGQAEPALANVSLRIEAGEFVGLVGPSGAGKTTLVDIIAGLIEPQGGSIRVGGLPFVDGVRAGWLDRLAYVPQEPFLFDTSVRDNLTWGRGDVADATLWQVLEAADAADVVRALPHGLASRVGERGQALSGGERQRLCLARALVRKPALLILDEATNALDLATEARVLARLAAQRRSMTVIMITHRTTSLAVADRVFEVAHGAVRLRPAAPRGMSTDPAPAIENPSAVSA